MSRGPEISDGVIDYDIETLARRPVQKHDALGQLDKAPGWARRIVQQIPERDGAQIGFASAA